MTTKNRHLIRTPGFSNGQICDGQVAHRSALVVPDPVPHRQGEKLRYPLVIDLTARNGDLMVVLTINKGDSPSKSMGTMVIQWEYHGEHDDPYPLVIGYIAMV